MNKIATANDSLRSSFAGWFERPEVIGPFAREVVYKDLAFAQANASRKALNKAKALRFVCDIEAVAERFSAKIFYSDIISQILETYLYGLNVFELNWHLKEGFYFPELVQRDFADFGLKDGEIYYTPAGFSEAIDARKVVYALHEPNFFNPAGEALINKLYKIIKLKNKTIENWAAFQEKFANPWTVAKTTANPDELADELNAMRSGDVAVVDTEETIELIQPASKAADFKELVSTLDNAIRSVILGGNLSSEVDGGSFAAAAVHDGVREDIANADLAGLLFVANKVCERFCEVNHFQGELYCELEPESDIKTELAQRDAIIAGMGFDLSPEYIKETYGVEVTKREAPTYDGGFGNSSTGVAETERSGVRRSQSGDAPNFRNERSELKQRGLLGLSANAAATPPKDEIDTALESEEFAKITKGCNEQISAQVKEIFKNASSYEEAFKLLSESSLSNDELALNLYEGCLNAACMGAAYED